MKNKIRHAFEQDTPDIWAGICYDCALQTAPQSASASKIVQYREPKPNFLADALQIAAIAAVFVLIVGGSIGLFGLRQNHHGGPSLGTNPPTPGITTQPTTRPSQPPTTEPVETTPPTEPPIDVSEYETYLKSPDLILVCDYNGDPDDIPDRPGLIANRDELEVGCTYIYNFETEYAYLLTRSPLVYQQLTSEHVYYILADEPGTVWRTDFCGEETVAIYRSDDQNLTSLYFYGKDTSGQLMVCDNYQKVFSVDPASRECTLLMEAYQILSFSYSQSSCAANWFFLEDDHPNYSTEFGETITFIGLLNKNDPDPSGYSGNRYYFFMQKDEYWVHYWNVSKWEFTQITKEVETTPPTEPSPPPSTDPTQPSEPLMEEFEAGMLDDPSLRTFIFEEGFDGDILWGNRVNVEGCVPGGLYVGQKNTDITYCITSDAVLDYKATNIYIYYVLESDPQTLIRSTFDGTQQQTILHFNGTPAYFSVFGDALGYVGTFEDDRHLVIYNISTGEIECQWEQTLWKPEQLTGSQIYFSRWDNSGFVEIIVGDPFPDEPYIDEAGFALNPVTGEYKVSWVYSSDFEG